MRLEIYDAENVLGYGFGRWLVKQIQQQLIINLNQQKLVQWDIFFNSDDVYERISDIDIATKDILMFGIRNLICEIGASKIIVRINPNLFVPGFDRVRVDSVCRLINFGNSSIKGYPLFTTVLQKFADNINDYVELYVGGIV